jgi:hypothetical protein
MKGATLFQWTPARTRLAVWVTSVLVGIGIYVHLSKDGVDLNLICRHNFESAELSVFVDGRLAYSDQISGTVKKRFGFLDKKIEGTFSKTLNISQGEHVIGVRLQSRAEGFDQTKQIEVNLIRGKESSILVSAQKGDLALSYKGAPASSTIDAAPGYFSTLRSLLFTVIGSVVSAAIAFGVQEFLKSRKAALMVERTSKTV